MDTCTSKIPPGGGFFHFQKASAAWNNQNVAGTSEVLEPPSLSISASPLLPWCCGQPCAKPPATNAPLQKRAAAFVLSQFVSLSPSLVLLRNAVVIFPRLHPASFTSGNTIPFPGPMLRRASSRTLSSCARDVGIAAQRLEKENIFDLATRSVHA